MRPVTILVTVAVLVASAVCIRLGFWQVSRLKEKHALNAAIRASESTPQLIVSGEAPPPVAALHRSMKAAGRFDEAHQFLLSGVLRDGEPGVEVVTPLRLTGGESAILVNRGWLPADDATTARPQDHPEPGERTVEGIAEPMKRGAGPPGPRRLAGPVAAPAPTQAAPDTLPADTTGAASDSVALYSVRWLDVDSIAPLLPYPVATYLVRQRPAPGVPDLPRRNPRPLHDESMHLTYAVQWFLFAILIPAGTAALAWSRRRRAARRPSPEATP